MIPVTKVHLPSSDKYKSYIDKIWETGWITNNGECVRELEDKLKNYLGVKHLFFVSNGTIAIQIAIKALELQGEVITTPFSYVATTSSIVWENCEPVFADIDAQSLCINPAEIESKITDKTSAIMATHVYGNACDVEAIHKIAEKHNLKVIYDAAHSFATDYKKESVLKWGDISTLSFHATKIFHTVEGGAVVTDNDEIAHKLSYLRNFGHKTPESFWGVGVNGKNSEMHAAMGLCMLDEIDDVIALRKDMANEYDAVLPKTGIQKPSPNSNQSLNYAYYPILLESEEKRIEVQEALNKENIFPRRYFYPSLNKLPYLKEGGPDMPVSESAGKRVLSLPFYTSLKKEEIKMVADIIKATVKV